MGTFRITIVATGGHGNDREKKHGATLELGMLPADSVDRVAFDAVEKLKSLGCHVSEGTLTHWPGSVNQVVDDVLNAKRLGSF